MNWIANGFLLSILKYYVISFGEHSNSLIAFRDINPCAYHHEILFSEIRVMIKILWFEMSIQPHSTSLCRAAVILVSSKKGERLIKAAQGVFATSKISLEDAEKKAPDLVNPIFRNQDREFFFSHLDLGYHKAIGYGKGMRFDVGIIGWWFASNYGSSLT